MSPAGRRPEPPEEADVASLRTVGIQGRLNKVASVDFAAEPGAGRSFRDFLDGLPHVLAADTLRTVARGVASAMQARKGVVWLLGGHVIKTGLSPILIRMIERGGATFVAGNGAVAIHDYEIARWGATSEDVEAGLVDGTFGMAEETGREMNEAIVAGAEQGMGMGEALGWALSQRDDLAAPGRSILLASYLGGVGCAIHAAIGAEIIHQHPAANGAAIGDTSLRDFRRLAAHLPKLHEGGFVLNVGSAVVMPEVFLKALAVARNLHDGAPRGFDSADFDMIRHYRPRMNVVERPTRTGGGNGYQVTGHHELMIPLLAWAIEECLAGDAADVG
ncbi:MAG: hypothetical protein FJ207_02335 [Gemmatimonadetes bacterium]|nr:hypothetical protein [Gemmatimonadota bacterium]